MRTALLAAVKQTTSGQLRALQPMAGRSAIAWQAALVRDVGCERILCICEAPQAELFALQNEVEASGCSFHAVRSNIQIASLIRSEDELVMLLDGLITDRDCLLHLLEGGRGLRRGIVTIPASSSLAHRFPNDFERIDRDRHWAGLATMTAAQVHKLADMPSDSDAMSLLLRLGLQAGVECHQLPQDLPENGRWLLASDAQALERSERLRIETSLPTDPWSGPFNALASQLVRRVGPRALSSGTEWSAAGAGFMMAVGIALVAFGHAPAGLGLSAVGAFVGGLGARWRLLRSALWQDQHADRLGRIVSAVIDALSATALVFAYHAEGDGLSQIALPLLAIGLGRILGREEGGLLAGFWRDRAIQLVLFAVAAASGWLGEALAIVALGALVQMMLRPTRF